MQRGGNRRAAAPERVQCRNPDRKKKGPRIPATTYDLVRKNALAALPAKAPGMTWVDFRDEMTRRLMRTKTFETESSAWWFTTAVKLDMEARDEIVRLADGPQRIIRR